MHSFFRSMGNESSVPAGQGERLLTRQEAEALAHAQALDRSLRLDDVRNIASQMPSTARPPPTLAETPSQRSVLGSPVNSHWQDIRNVVSTMQAWDQPPSRNDTTTDAKFSARALAAKAEHRAVSARNAGKEARKEASVMKKLLASANARAAAAEAEAESEETEAAMMRAELTVKNQLDAATVRAEAAEREAAALRAGPPVALADAPVPEHIRNQLNTATARAEAAEAEAAAATARAEAAESKAAAATVRAEAAEAEAAALRDECAATAEAAEAEAEAAEAEAEALRDEIREKKHLALATHTVKAQLSAALARAEAAEVEASELREERDVTAHSAEEEAAALRKELAEKKHIIAGALTVKKQLAAAISRAEAAEVEAAALREEADEEAAALPRAPPPRQRSSSVTRKAAVEAHARAASSASLARAVSSKQLLPVQTPAPALKEAPAPAEAPGSPSLSPSVARNDLGVLFHNTCDGNHTGTMGRAAFCFAIESLHLERHLKVIGGGHGKVIGTDRLYRALAAFEPSSATPDKAAAAASAGEDVDAAIEEELRCLFEHYDTNNSGEMGRASFAFAIDALHLERHLRVVGGGHGMTRGRDRLFRALAAKGGNPRRILADAFITLFATLDELSEKVSHRNRNAGEKLPWVAWATQETELQSYRDEMRSSRRQLVEASRMHSSRLGVSGYLGIGHPDEEDGHEDEDDHAEEHARATALHQEHQRERHDKMMYASAQMSINEEQFVALFDVMEAMIKQQTDAKSSAHLDGEELPWEGWARQKVRRPSFEREMHRSLKELHRQTSSSALLGAHDAAARAAE